MCQDYEKQGVLFLRGHQYGSQGRNSYVRCEQLRFNFFKSLFVYEVMLGILWLLYYFEKYERHFNFFKTLDSGFARLKAILKLLIFFFLAHNFSAQTASAQTISMIYGSGLHPLVEISDQGQAQTQVLNIFGPGGQVLAQVVNGEIRYLLADHERSTRIVLNKDNSLLGNFGYTPYGETNSTGDVASVLYRYTGQPVNSEFTGLNSYHFYQREYDPNTLRFTSVDPAMYNESPYIYSNSNPTNFMDFTGGQPQYITLWLSQWNQYDPSDISDTQMKLVSLYNSSSQDNPTRVILDHLSLAGTGPSVNAVSLRKIS